jgi:hypothetical protein
VCSCVGRCVFACVCVGGPVAKPFPIVDVLRAGNQDGAELIGKPFLSYKWSRPYGDMPQPMSNSFIHLMYNVHTSEYITACTLLFYCTERWHRHTRVLNCLGGVICVLINS